jgi:hypothetical protein
VEQAADAAGDACKTEMTPFILKSREANGYSMPFVLVDRDRHRNPTPKSRTAPPTAEKDVSARTEGPGTVVAQVGDVNGDRISTRGGRFVMGSVAGEIHHRYRAIGGRHFERTALAARLSPEQLLDLKVATSVLPFRVNDYVLDE